MLWATIFLFSPDMFDLLVDKSFALTGPFHAGEDQVKELNEQWENIRTKFFHKDCHFNQAKYAERFRHIYVG